MQLIRGKNKLDIDREDLVGKEYEMTRIKLYLYSVLMMIFVAPLSLFGSDEIQSFGGELNLTLEQIEVLQDVINEYSETQFELEGKITLKLTEMRLDLYKKDRFETESKAKDSAKRINKIVKEIGNLYGKSLKAKVGFILGARDESQGESGIYPWGEGCTDL